MIGAENYGNYDFSLKQELVVSNSLHQSQHIELKPRYIPRSEIEVPAQQFKDMLTGLGYILSGDTRRLDHLSTPENPRGSTGDVIGYDSKLNDRLLMGTRKRTGEDADLIIFNSSLDRWH